MNSNNRKNSRNMYNPYNGISRQLVLDIYDFVIKLRNKKKMGQRSLVKEIKRIFNIDFSENTISGWIHKHIIPFANEKTQFKSKPVPPKKELYGQYIQMNTSASKLAKKYNVSTISIINWLKKSGIKPRTHIESMNTLDIKKELSELRLTKPTKDYKFLSSEKAYVLGVLCGDGYIDKNFLKLEIRKDTEFIKEFLRCIEEVYGIKYWFYYYPKRSSYISNVTSRLICSDLLHYGCFRTNEWDVPSSIMSTKEEKIISSFLRGVYDSEGSSDRYKVVLTSISEKAIHSISGLLNQLNINNRIKNDRNYFTIYITKRENLQKFKDLVGFTIKRKMDRLKW